MAKLLLVYFLLLGVSLTCGATTYMVGDTSGWDISTGLDTWAQDKKFVVGDVLVFQYSSSNSVDEVTKENYDSCNTSNVVRTFANGNTTVPLTEPGTRYFISGNKLYCLGGMKLQVNVEGNSSNGSANSPVSAPQAQPGTTLPQPSSKSNNRVVPTSSSAGISYGGMGSLGMLSLGLVWFLCYSRCHYDYISL